MKKLFFISFLFCLTSSTMAQVPKNEILVSAGMLRGKMLDKQASPLVYQHHATSVALGYVHRSKRARLFATLATFLGTNLPVRFGERTFGNEEFNYTIASASYGADLGLSYLRLISKGNKDLKFYLGGKLENRLSVSDAIANFYWAMNVASLQAQFLGEYTIDAKHRLSVEIHTPFFAAVTRHTYANFPKSADDTNFIAFFSQGTALTGPHRLHEITAQAGYHFQMSRNISFGADWDLYWLSYSKPRSIRTFSHSLLFSIGYSL